MPDAAIVLLRLAAVALICAVVPVWASRALSTGVNRVVQVALIVLSGAIGAA